MLHTANELMSKSQLLPCEVSNGAVLEAIRATPREHYVPANLAGVAYVDEDIPVTDGHYMLEPLTFARLLEAAEIQPSDNVLDVACCYGYGPAVLSRLAGQVTALEANQEMALAAKKALLKNGITDVDVITAPLADGLEQKQPYNVIVVEGAVQKVPDKLLAQLAEGGRLVAVQSVNLRPGTRFGLGYVVLMEKIDGAIVSRRCKQASAALLPGFEKIETFRF